MQGATPDASGTPRRAGREKPLLPVDLGVLAGVDLSNPATQRARQGRADRHRVEAPADGTKAPTGATPGRGRGRGDSAGEALRVRVSEDRSRRERRQAGQQRVQQSPGDTSAPGGDRKSPHHPSRRAGPSGVRPRSGFRASIADGQAVKPTRCARPPWHTNPHACPLDAATLGRERGRGGAKGIAKHGVEKRIMRP